MIEAYVGLPRSGKTLGCVFQVCKALASGRTVYSNCPVVDYVFGSQRRSTDFTRLSELTDKTNALAFIDELNAFLPSRRYNAADISVLRKFSQAGKQGLDLLYTSQMYGFVDNYVRGLTNWVWFVVNLGFTYRYDRYNPYIFERKLKSDNYSRSEIVWLFKGGLYRPWFTFKRVPNLLKNLYKSYDTSLEIQGIL